MQTIYAYRVFRHGTYFDVLICISLSLIFIAEISAHDVAEALGAPLADPAGRLGGGQAVSQNVLIWVGNDIQMKIIFHSHLHFSRVIFQSQIIPNETGLVSTHWKSHLSFKNQNRNAFEK